MGRRRRRRGDRRRDGLRGGARQCRLQLSQPRGCREACPGQRGCRQGNQAACAEQSRLDAKDAAQQEQYLNCLGTGFSGAACRAAFKDVVVALSSYSGIAPYYLPAQERHALLLSDGNLDELLKILVPQGVGSLSEDKREELGKLVGLLTGDFTGFTAIPAILDKLSKDDPAALSQVFGTLTHNAALAGLGKAAAGASDAARVEAEPAGGSGGAAATSASGSKATEKITWIDESANMSPEARAYEDGAMGARYAVAARKAQAPALKRTTADGQEMMVRFDGVDGDVLIDRKLSVFTSSKTRDQIARQSAALQQNGLTGRWEVPTEAEANRAIKMFDELGVTNITVKVVPK